ncbi:TetR/AcrR family transcriptional regulator, partial [Rhizobiaceae sp. 2RAB30]
SSGNLFHYFPSKQAIFTAIFEQDGRDSALRLELSADANDPLAALLGFVSWMVGQSAYPHLAGLMLEVIANAKRDADFATLLERNDRATHKGLVALLRRAAQAGQIDPALDPETAANWIMVLIEGVFVRASADSGFQAVDHRGTLRRIIFRYLNAAAPTMPEPQGIDAPRSPGPSPDGPLRLRGIDYDTGTNYWGGQLSRQIWNRRTVQEHMRVIREDLHCNAVCVSGTNIERLM